MAEVPLYRLGSEDTRSIRAGRVLGLLWKQPGVSGPGAAAFSGFRRSRLSTLRPKEVA